MKSFEKRSLLAICDRLMKSRNPAESRSIYQGRHYHQGYPVLLDTDLLYEHKHIIGPTGSGKTSLGLQTDLLQLIHRNEGPVVIFDCKGDPGLFHFVESTARSHNRTFKWFTNKPHRSTYVFNPWDNRLLKQLSLPDILGLHMQGLNLHHGSGYGRDWFSILTRTVFRRSILETIPNSSEHPTKRSKRKTLFLPEPIQSFRDLTAILTEMTDDNEELRSAKHLAFIAESLADFKQLNLSPNRDMEHKKALENAIFMPEVIRKKQIIYFYLVGAMDVAAVSMIAKLGLYSLLMAAIAYHDEYGEAPKVIACMDEVQAMIGQNIENILAQARSYGLGCILAHQTMSQLNPPGGPDLREIVMNCSATKSVYGARDPWMMNFISNTSGVVRYYDRKYDLSPDDLRNGRIDAQYACRDREGDVRVGISEYTAPRINSQDILNMNSHPQMSLMWINRFSGLTAFQGWFPLYSDWPISKTEHEDYRRTPWPQESEETITMKSVWPDQNEYTIIPTNHPPITCSPEELDTDGKLKNIWKEIEEK